MSFCKAVSNKRHFLKLGAVAVLGAVGLSSALPALAAAAYPTQPVTIVVAYAVGGDTDAMARLFGEKLAQKLGQPVIIENRGGASGIIGSNYVARAKHLRPGHPGGEEQRRDV
jgi:tripartite-type tricarboxylate transporter receptor subunit TctC